MRHPGSRQAPAPPHIARAFKALQRRVDDLGSQKTAAELHAVQASISLGLPCTGPSYADTWRMWTYRDGANVYADIAVSAGAASVVRVRLACADYGVTGTPAATGAPGEQVLRASLAMPDAWPPGEAHYVTVQAFRASGTDATTLQVLRGWQR